MNAYSITAPEEIAKEYGGNKKKIQQAAAQGLINPTEAVMAGMFIDRMRNAAQAEQAQQPTVAEQVMNPQPQMPPQGMAATPQAQQMAQRPPQMGMPQQMPRMAMGGGVNSIDYVEGNYAPGGIVSFAPGGAMTKQQLLSQLNQAYMAAGNAQERAQIKAQIDNIQKMGTVTSPGGQAVTDSRLNQDASFTGAAPLAEAQLASPNEGDIARTEAILGKARFMNPQTTLFDQLKNAEPAAVPGEAARQARIAAANPVDTAPVEESSGFTLPGFDAYLNNMRADTQDAKRLQRQVSSTDDAGLLGAVEQGKKIASNVPAGIGSFGLGDEGTIARAEAILGKTRAMTPKQTEAPAGLAATQEARDFGVDAVPLTAAQQEMQDNVMRMSERRANVGLIPDWLKGRRFQDQDQDTDRMPTRDDVRAKFEAEQAAKAAEAESTFVPKEGTMLKGDEALAKVAELEKKEAELRAAAQTESGSESVSDQINNVQEVVEKVNAPKVEATDPTAASAALTAIQEQSKAITDKFDSLLTEADGDFNKKIEEIMKPAAKGEFRKEMEALVKDRDARFKSAKKEAFSMALLQAGLGMLGQGGGQTALQALGKAALPATKQYADSITAAKKEDRELLQLGLSLEQMDAKEKAATDRLLAQVYGQRANSIRQTATQLATNANTVAASLYSSDVAERVGMKKAAATQAIAEGQAETNLLTRLSSSQASSLEGIRKIQTDINDVTDDVRKSQQFLKLPKLEMQASAPDASAEVVAEYQALKARLDEEIERRTSGLNRLLRQRENELAGIQRQLLPNTVAPGDIASSRVK